MFVDVLYTAEDVGSRCYGPEGYFKRLHGSTPPGIYTHPCNTLLDANCFSPKVDEAPTESVSGKLPIRDDAKTGATDGLPIPSGAMCHSARLGNSAKGGVAPDSRSGNSKRVWRIWLVSDVAMVINI